MPLECVADSVAMLAGMKVLVFERHRAAHGLVETRRVLRLDRCAHQELAGFDRSVR
jgi:hypothetical protein